MALMFGQSAAPIAAADLVSGPVYGGSFAWTIPALTTVAPTGNGFLGITTFHGRFLAAERNGIVSSSMDGATWVGRLLPGPIGDANTAVIAAGTNRVAIMGMGVAWTSLDGDAWMAASAAPQGPAKPTAMIALADGFVAIGIASGGRRAAAWSSADGSTWVASPDQSAFAHFCPTALAASPAGRVVAVGDDCYPNLARPAAAISDDGGLTWRRAPAQTPLSEEGLLTGVVAGGPGFLAVGSVIRDVYPGWPPGAAMFVSADGLTWRRVGYFAKASLFRYGQGPFLAAVPGGYLAVDTGTGRPSTFVSVDGLRWTRSTPLPATPGTFDSDVSDAFKGFAVNGNAIVGVGTTDQLLSVDAPRLGAFSVVGALTPRPAVIGQIPVPPVVPTPRPPSVQAQPHFPGRVTWAVAPLPVSVPPGDAAEGSWVADITRWRGGFAAVGWEILAKIGGRSVVWTSADGARWTDHPLPPGCDYAGEIAATRSTIVVASNAGICRSTDGVRWTRATDTPHRIGGLADVIAAGTGFVLTMSYDTASLASIRVWRSSDGLYWRTAGHPAAFTNRRPFAVATGPRGIVILGQRFLTGSRQTVVPLRSRDAITWSSGLRQAAFEPESPGLGRMISGGPGYIAAGSYQPRSRVGAAIWTSSDGLAWKRVHVVLPASGFVEFDGLARIGPGYAVVGLLSPASQENPARPSVWLSPDGSRWRSAVSLPLPTDGTLDWVQLTGAAGGSAGLVAVGNRSETGRHPAAEVWTGTYLAP
jgi:hypothetical protein